MRKIYCLSISELTTVYAANTSFRVSLPDSCWPDCVCLCSVINCNPPLSITHINRNVGGRQSLRHLSDAEALPLRRNSKRFNSSFIICVLVLCDAGSAASHEYNGDYKNLMRLTKISRSSSAHNQRHAVRAEISADRSESN